MAREFVPGSAPISTRHEGSSGVKQERTAVDAPSIKKGSIAGNPTAQVNNRWGTQSSAADRRNWLLNNPDFDEKPATMEEFLGPRYLDIDPAQNPNLQSYVGVRAGVKESLIEIFGESIDPTGVSKIKRGIFMGGIGVGKSTLASIALTYMVHWVSCLHNPQQFFGLLPGSRIAFMLMSTRAQHAVEVMFGDIKARVNSCKWFQNNCVYDPKLKKQLRFPNDIWIIPGTSEETSAEGYNILGAVIDEGDSHKVTPNKDYAEEAWNTLSGRISSRFMDPKTKDHRGLLLAVGQTKKSAGFMTRKKDELTTNGKPNQLVIEMTIWDSLGWQRFLKDNGERDSFFFDIVRKREASKAQSIGGRNVIEIPNAYRQDFDNDPVRALKDHAGIPPAVDDPFITMIDRVDDAQDKWEKRYKGSWRYAVNSSSSMPEFHPDFIATNNLKRAVHVDIAFAPGGDALGMAMGHIPEMIEIDDELKPVIVFDFLMRIKPGSGSALELATFRRILYHLRDDLKFKIGVVTFDGFQSQDSIQILRKKHFNVGEVSVDRTKAPYEELREAIYERRVEFPKYMTYLNRGDNEKVNISRVELSELQDNGRKVDHPEKGSKDLADAMAGVVYDLMSNTSFRRGSSKPGREAKPDRQIDDELEYNSKVYGRTVDLDDGIALDGLIEQSGPARYPAAERTGYGLPEVERDPFGLGALRR